MKVTDEPSIPNQKVGLLKALLAIGDLSHAKFILYRFEQISAAYPEIGDLIGRIVHVSIEKVYRKCSPTRKLSDRATANRALPRPSYPSPPVTKQVVLTTSINKHSTPTTIYQFFYRGWVE